MQSLGTLHYTKNKLTWTMKSTCNPFLCIIMHDVEKVTMKRINCNNYVARELMCTDSEFNLIQKYIQNHDLRRINSISSSFISVSLIVILLEITILYFQWLGSEDCSTTSLLDLINSLCRYEKENNEFINRRSAKTKEHCNRY